MEYNRLLNGWQRGGSFDGLIGGCGGVGIWCGVTLGSGSLIELGTFHVLRSWKILCVGGVHIGGVVERFCGVDR